MKREIKFRAFDTEMQKYTEGQFILSSVRKREITLEGVSIDGDADDSNEEVVFEQFTLLKDKNGKDIYEGDILRHPNSGLFEVKFEDYGFYLFYNGIKQKNHNTSNMEIIGNIHQNANLLTK